MKQPRKRVFISYAEETPKDRDSVRTLGNLLVSRGIEVISVLNLPAELDARGWVESMLRRADLVLLVCSRLQLQHVVIGEGSPDATLVSNWLDGPEQSFVVPVVLKPGDVAFVPKQLLHEAPTSIKTWDQVDALAENLVGRPGRHDVRAQRRENTIPIPPSLISALASGECVLYGGSGLSARAGLPTWHPFVSGLLDWMVAAKKVDSDFAESLREALAAGEIGPVADSLVGSETAGGEVQAYLAAVFGDNREDPLPRVHELLSRLPFRAVLTTNFDNLLERALKPDRTYTHHDAELLLAALAKPDPFVVKLYGTVESPESLVISPGQFGTTLAENRLLAKFTETLFVSKTLLFLGASLDGINDFLGGLRVGTNTTREHFAVLDVTGNAWKVKAEALKRRYGITVIPYQPSAGWPELDTFVSDLASEVEREKHRSATTAAGHANAAQGLLLRRVELINIGPFDHVELEFGPQWNLLLGDNGVGKSSVLRAIAVALAGTDARSYAGRLIRRGQTKGTIILDTVRGRYVTELFVTESEAEMSTPSGSPLAVEGWLTLGFPALRALTWNRTQGSTGRERPDAEDVLPLLRGEPDPRPDQLKMWLVGLDHQIQSLRQRSNGQSGGEVLEATRTKLFDVIQALTPGLRLEYAATDPRTREVTVRTDDGVVPLELVSQGTSSLLGWVGVLLKRQVETNVDDIESWNRPALILIDEIDAHMHPAWQQQVTATTRKLFPNLQVIATTHSPLIALSQEPSQVVALRREEGRVVLRRAPPEVAGLTADQILTSKLFGLETTLAPDTEETLREYSELAIKDAPSEDDEMRMAALAARLKVRPPSAAHREEARTAFGILQSVLEEKVEQLPIEDRRKVLEEMKLHLQESITGSGRPA